MDSFDESLDSKAFSEGESEESFELKKNAKVYKKVSSDALPPPIPLLSKSFCPSEPIFQSQNIPFEILPNIIHKDYPEPFGNIVDQSTFPLRYDSHITLKSLFSKEKIVFLRSETFLSEKFNKNICDLNQIPQNYKKHELKLEKNRVNPNLHLKVPRFYTISEKDSTLVFESRFECGNLAMAAKEKENEYNLLLQNDINSKGHTQ